MKIKNKIMMCIASCLCAFAFLVWLVIPSYAGTDTLPMPANHSIIASYKDSDDRFFYTMSADVGNLGIHDIACFCYPDGRIKNRDVGGWVSKQSLNGSTNVDHNDGKFYHTEFNGTSDIDYYVYAGTFESPYYIFSSKQKAQDFLDGKIDASEAINYDDVVDNQAEYDGSIPAPRQFYFDSQSENRAIIKVIFDRQFSGRTSGGHHVDTGETSDDGGDGFQLHYDLGVKNYYLICDRTDYDLKNLEAIRVTQYSDTTIHSAWSEYKEASVLSQNNFRKSNLCYVDDLIDMSISDTQVMAYETDIHKIEPWNYSKYGTMSNSEPYKIVDDGAYYFGTVAELIPWYKDDKGVKHYGDTYTLSKMLFSSAQSGSIVRPVNPPSTEEPNTEYPASTEINTPPSTETPPYIPSSEEDVIPEDIDIDISDLPKLINLCISYFKILKPFLDSVPASIWSLIGLGLTISLALSVMSWAKGGGGSGGGCCGGGC